MTASLKPDTCQHTPGPWEHSHREGSGGMYRTEVYDSAGETIAEISWYAVGVKDGWVTARDANARLIAAAPDMLAALKGYLDLFDTMANGIEVSPLELAGARYAMRVAAAKAEGL